MTSHEKLNEFKKDLARCNVAEIATPDKIRTIMLDPDIKKSNWASNYLLKSFGIPAAYFRKVSANHQAEIMNHAVRTYPQKELAIVLENDSLIAAGPNETMAFSDLDKILFTDKDNKDIFVYGDLFDRSSVQIYKVYDMFESGYKLGICAYISAMFYQGMSIQPLIFEIICENGMIDSIEGGVKLKVKGLNCTDKVIEEIQFLALETLNKRKNTYSEVLNELENKVPLTIPQLNDTLFRMGLLQTFREKTLNNTSAIEEGSLRIAILPSSIDTRRDNLSVMTYTAQAFHPHTRQRIEEAIFTGLPLLKAA